MTNAQFYLLVALPSIGILANVAFTLRLSAGIDRMSDRLLTRTRALSLFS